MIDVPWNGFSQSKKVGDLAEVYQHNVAPHNYYSHLSSFVSASLCATLPNVRIMEIDIDDIPWKDELTTTVPGDNRRLHDRPYRSRLGRRHQRRSSPCPPLGRKQPVRSADAGVQGACAVETNSKQSADIERGVHMDAPFSVPQVCSIENSKKNIYYHTEKSNRQSEPKRVYHSSQANFQVFEVGFRCQMRDSSFNNRHSFFCGCHVLSLLYM